MHLLLKGRKKGATGCRERGSEERNPEPAREPEAAPEGGGFGLPGRAGARRRLPRKRPGLRESRARGCGAEKARGKLCPPSARPELGPRRGGPCLRPPAPARLTEVTGAAQRPRTAGRAGAGGRAPTGSARKRPGPAGTPTPGKGRARPGRAPEPTERSEETGRVGGEGGGRGALAPPVSGSRGRRFPPPRHLATTEALPPAHAQQPRTLAALDVPSRCLLRAHAPLCPHLSRKRARRPFAWRMREQKCPRRRNPRPSSPTSACATKGAACCPLAALSRAALGPPLCASMNGARRGG